MKYKGIYIDHLSICMDNEYGTHVICICSDYDTFSFNYTFNLFVDYIDYEYVLECIYSHYMYFKKNKK